MALEYLLLVLVIVCVASFQQGRVDANLVTAAAERKICFVLFLTIFIMLDSALVSSSNRATYRQLQMFQMQAHTHREREREKQHRPFHRHTHYEKERQRLTERASERTREREREQESHTHTRKEERKSRKMNNTNRYKEIRI